MNPRIPTEPDPQVSKYIDNFIKYILSKEYSAEYKRDIINNVTAYFKDYKLTTPEALANHIPEGKKFAVIAARLFLSYLQEQEILDKRTVEDYKIMLHYRDRANVDIFVPDNAKIKEAYSKLQTDRERLYFYLLAASGIRITEMITLLTVFDPKKEIKGKGFNKYPLSDDRGNKRVYYVYYPDNLELSRKYKVYGSSVKKVFYRANLPAKYLRKWQYNFLISNGVSEGICDYIQGRSSESIGSMHYLNKVKLADEYYRKVVKKLKALIPYPYEKVRRS